MARTRIWDADNGVWLDVGGTVAVAPGGLPAAQYKPDHGVQTVNNTTFTNIIFHTDARVDDPRWSWNGNRDTLTVNEDGWYHVAVGLEFDTSAIGQYSCLIRVDGTLVSGNTMSSGGGSLFNPRLSTSIVTYLQAGQTLDLRAYQNTGGNLPVDGQGTFFSITKLEQPPVAVPVLNGTAMRRSISAPQSIPNATTTAIDFDTTDHSVGTGLDVTTTTSRFVCVDPGVYHFDGTVQFDGDGSNARQVIIRKNGSFTDDVARVTWPNPDGNASYNYRGLSGDVLLGAGDYVELLVWQNTGSALNVVRGVLGAHKVIT